MQILINKRVHKRIQPFYYNAILKYPNTYSPDNADKDIDKVHNELYKIGVSLINSDISLPKWEKYSVCRSKLTNWYFAYKIQNDIVYIYDAENGRNMSSI
jgi:hypothetical protein